MSIYELCYDDRNKSSKIITVNGLSETLTGLDSNRKYYVKVRAISKENKVGSWSGEAWFITDSKWWYVLPIDLKLN